MKKKHIIKRPPTRVHSFRCTEEVWTQLKAQAKECGLSVNRYLTETGLKHHPRQRLTKEEVDALNSLTYARTDLIKISAELIQHWYDIEKNITSPVLTKERSEP